MGRFDRQIATAKRLIAAKGQTVDWQKPDTPGGTASKPTAGTPGAIYHPTIVFLPIEREYLATILSFLKNTDVPGGYVYGLMAQQDFKPELFDTVTRTVDGVDEIYGILPENGIEEYNPDGTGAILYVVRFTR